MGEETKEEEKKEGEDKKAEEPEEIVLKVDMHCEGCAKKVRRSLNGFEGVEDVKTDSKSHKVVVKGKTADPIKVCERIQKKSGRKAELISPLPKPPEEDKKPEENKPEEKKEEPAVVTVVLNVRMHCDACAQLLRKRIQKIDGVESVEPDVKSHQITVKGVLDPTKLVEFVQRRTRKQAAIVPEEKKEENKEEKKEANKEENKKEENKEEKKEVEEGKGEDNYNDAKKSEYWPSKYYSEFANAPQIFSDENPNACFIM